MSNARRRGGSREPEEQPTEEPEEEKEEDYGDSRISLPQLFVTLQQLGNHGKKWKSLKKSRSLPSSIFSSEDTSEESFEYTMVFEKRGYFYESVGGVFYTLEWPLKSSGSSTEVEMPPHIETTENPVKVKEPDQSKCGKLLCF